ncbi:MAG TPA: hypothetical protein ENN84_03845 [Candidatus Marinimicrobia bacterium]|nr:hypothetical protein [Candidatus Neomarinimicrobiota bacterium]
MRRFVWILFLAFPLMASDNNELQMTNFELQDTGNGEWKKENGKWETLHSHFLPLTAHRFVLAFQSSIINHPSPILVNGWAQGRLSGQWVIQDSLRSWLYSTRGILLPGIEWIFLEKGDWTADMEFRLQANYDFTVTDKEKKSAEDMEIYRGWLRFYSPFSEFRIGYQQLNFGSGRYGRALNWFDNINYLDPQKMTAGVWGARMQLFYHNNANLWLWSLYGNENIRDQSWDIQKDKPEFGGRLQVPIFNGEMGFTGHYREVEKELNTGIERRIGLDGVWDPIIGIWFESSLASLDIPEYGWNNEWLRWNHVTGLDYTFGIGNGLNIAIEGTISGKKSNPSEWNSFHKAWSLHHQYRLYASYLFSILDQIYLSAILSEDSDFVSGGLAWVRSTDDWTIYLSVSDLSSRIFTEDLTKRHTISTSLWITRYF